MIAIVKSPKVWSLHEFIKLLKDTYVCYSIISYIFKAHVCIPTSDLKGKWSNDASSSDSMSLLQKVKSEMESPDWNVSMVDIHLQKLLWVYCPGQAGLKGTTEQIDWQAKQPSQMACFLEDPKCWGAWYTTCGHKAKDITPSIAWRREAWKEEAVENLPWKDERGPSSIRQTLELFQRWCWGNFWEAEWSFWELRDTILNWTDLNWNSSRHDQLEPGED